MYSLYWLGVRITLKGVDELPLLAIEVRKATKSTGSTKYDTKGVTRSLLSPILSEESPNVLKLEEK